MSLTQGEAQVTARKLRQVAADMEHVASLLPWVADGKAAPVVAIATLNSAIEAAQAIMAQLATDLVD